jgi:4'-phosphopantetheinyl transferase
MIKVLYTIFEDKENNPLFKRLPRHVVEDAFGYQKREDRLARLYGKLLLIEGFRKMNFDTGLINSIRYSAHHRPYVSSTLDFNISHAGQCVVCVLSNTFRVGIDVERIKPIELSDFQHVWTQRERADIASSRNPYEQFYTYWTRKEAIIKADGRGMNLSLTDINVTDLVVDVASDRWYLKKVPLHKNYMAHLAADQPVNSLISIEQLDLSPD